jgi:hypothetical protein
MDAIAAVLYSEYWERDYLVGSMLKQIYTRYIQHFLTEDRQLSFSFSQLQLHRLLSHFSTHLFSHFVLVIDFPYNLYPLVQWVLTMFAH